MRTKVFTFIYMVVLLLWSMSTTSCNDPRTYDHYESVSVKGWERNDTLTFNLPRQWEGSYELSLGLRASQTFPYRSVSLIVESAIINYKHKKKLERMRRDTIHCEIITDKGMLAGQDGISNTEIRQHVASFQLNRNDSLHITIHHVMSRNSIPGISDIGLRLQKR